MSQEMCETAKIILATPSKPIATAGCENIDIKWKSITGATLYMLYRNDALIASLPDTAWTDYDPGISSVCYKVMASNSCGDSPPSQKTCNALKTPPDASSITPAVSPVNPEIGHNYTISWPSVSGASSYVLYESGIQIDSGVFLSKTFNKHSYNSFRYEVSGCNGCGCGGKSNQCIIDIALDISNADDMSLPTSYAISQNYPNPFNSATKISFDVPHLSHVSIEIFDIMGRRLVLIIDQDMPAGKYNIVWTGIDANGINAPSGVYFYKMKAEGFVESRKMMILK